MNILTDEEIDKATEHIEAEDGSFYCTNYEGFARAIEKAVVEKLREKANKIYIEEMFDEHACSFANDENGAPLMTFDEAEAMVNSIMEKLFEEGK